MNKTLISIRLDNDLVDWFRNRFTKGYQTKMNQVLRAYFGEMESSQQRLIGRAQQVYLQYYAQCFWHFQKDIKITARNIHMVHEGLRKYGGREGLLLAEELSDVSGISGFSDGKE